MSNRLKFILGLLIFFALIGVYFLDEYLNRKEERMEETSAVALYFENKDIKKVRFHNANGTFAFERNTFFDPWFMTAPKQLYADQDAVNNMLVLLRNISVQREINSTENIQSTGLENPRIRVELTLENGKSQSLEFGEDLTTIDKDEFHLPSAYAKSSAKKPILVIDNSSISFFEENNYHTFRTKQVANFKLGDIESIEVKDYTASNNQENPLSTLLQVKDSKWIAKRPVSTDASDEFVLQYLQYVLSLISENVIDDADKKTKELGINLEKPAATISMKSRRQGQNENLTIFMSKSGVYVQLADGALAQFELDEWTSLVPQFKSFRNRSVFLNTECSATFSSLTAVDVLDNVSDKDLEKFGLNKPQRTLFCAPQNSENHTAQPKVFIGNRVPLDEKSIYLKRSDSNIVYIVDAELLSALAD